MAVEFTCDGCGKRERGDFNRNGDAMKPHVWFQRTDDDGTRVVCSRRYIETVAKRTGKTRVVLPF